MVININLLEFDLNKNTFYAEASSLGIPVGKTPMQITVLPRYVFKIYQKLKTPDQEKTLGWQYKTDNGFELVLYND